MRIRSLAVVLVGIAATTAVVLTEGGPFAASEAKVRIQVPFGHVGDAVTYSSLWTAHQQADGSLSGQTLRFTTGFEVPSFETAIDRMGEQHKVLLVRLGKAFDSSYPYSNVTDDVLIDLETRDVIQALARYDDGSFRAATLELGPWSDNLYWDLFGPHDDAPLDEGWWANDTFEFQGRALTYGEDRTAADWNPLVNESIEAKGLMEACGNCDIVIRPQQYHYSSRVDKIGQWNGEPVVGLVRIVEIDYIRIVGQQRDLRPWHETITTTTWFSPKVPYPVRIERSDVRVGTPATHPVTGNIIDPVQNYTVVHDLAQFEPGVIPIPWGDCDGEHYRNANPELERGQAPHPVDGAATSVPFPLERALEAVAEDRSLVRFGGWRSRHPENFLVGAELFRGVRPGTGWLLPNPVFAQIGRQGDDLLAWELVFATGQPSDGVEQAFVVTSTMNDTTDAIQNFERGPARVTSAGQFRPDQLPKEPVSLAAIESVWKALVPPNRTQSPPTWVDWGQGWSIVADGTSSTGTMVVGGTRTALYNAGLGRCDERREAVRMESTPFPELGMNCSFVSVNLTTGATAYVLTFDYEEGYLPPVGSTLEMARLDESSAARAVAEWPSPIGPAVGVAGSLLLALLVAYFLPVLKFALAQVWTIPAFAKLRSDLVLKNRLRGRLIELIRNDPGITPPELHRIVGGGWSTVVYHLTILERNKMVSSLIDGRHRRFFPVGTVDHSRRAQVGILRAERTRRLYEAIVAEPGIIQGRLRLTVGLSGRGTLWHLERLVTGRLVGRDRVGRHVRYYALDAEKIEAARPELV